MIKKPKKTSLGGSRWVAPSALYAFGALALGGGAILARVAFGPRAAILLGAVGALAALWVAQRATLYPRVYLGRPMAFLGLLLSLVSVNESLGAVGYNVLWRRSFQVNGVFAVYTDPTAGWRVEHPTRWVTVNELADQSITLSFKPSMLSQSMIFSVTRKPGDGKTDVRDWADRFLFRLPKSDRTLILERRPFRYPDGRDAFELIYEDPLQTLPLRHRIVFVNQGNELFMLSVAATPGHLDRLGEEAERFLLSLRAPSAIS